MKVASGDPASTGDTVWAESGRRVKEEQPTSAQHMWELLQTAGEASSRLLHGAKTVHSCCHSSTCPLAQSHIGHMVLLG